MQTERTAWRCFIPWRRWVLALVLALPGCWRLHRKPDVDPIEEALKAADALFDARAESEERLLAAIEAYREVLAMATDDPRVLWRIARAYTALGYGYPSEASPQHFDLAREYGLRCLARNTGYASRLDAAGGRINERAVRRLGVPERACLEQTLVAWLRWVEVRGPAAALDLQATELLARQARELDPGRERWIPGWSIGMVEALRPGRMSRDLEVMEQGFADAIAAEPGLAIPTADRARLVLPGLGDREALEVALHEVEGWPEGEATWALENRAARAQARALLEDPARVLLTTWQWREADPR
ncbi:MAG: hypothetical protein H6739_02720 [Alphaproteobacteria bacterium]|nr:hypothetical protein [Alphaproteobacteria bacterium]